MLEATNTEIFYRCRFATAAVTVTVLIDIDVNAARYFGFSIIFRLHFSLDIFNV